MSQTSSTRRSYNCDPNNNNAKETLLKDTNGNVIQRWQMTKPKSLKGFNLRTTTPWISPKTKAMDDDNDFMYFSAEKVNTEDFIQSGGRANVTVNDKDIALVSHDNVVYAIQEKCPHVGGPLHLGDIEDVPGCGPCIKCPWHSWTFSLQTGKCIAPSGRDVAGHLEIFPVTINTERSEIRVGFTEIASSIFNTPPK